MRTYIAEGYRRKKRSGKDSLSQKPHAGFELKEELSRSRGTLSLQPHAMPCHHSLFQPPHLASRTNDRRSDHSYHLAHQVVDMEPLIWGRKRASTPAHSSQQTGGLNNCQSHFARSQAHHYIQSNHSQPVPAKSNSGSCSHEAH